MLGPQLVGLVPTVRQRLQNVYTQHGVMAVPQTYTYGLCCVLEIIQ